MAKLNTIALELTVTETAALLQEISRNPLLGSSGYAGVAMRKLRRALEAAQDKE